MMQNHQDQGRREGLKALTYSKIEELNQKRDESSDAAKELVHEALEPLRDCLPASSNLLINPHLIRGQWDTLFSHFGAHHTSGIMPPCSASLCRLSLGSLKGGAVTLVKSMQEIEPSTNTCNNIMIVETQHDPKVTAFLTLYGTYEMDTSGSRCDQPIRNDDGRHHEMNLLVTFRKIALACPELSEKGTRTAFGVEGPLSVDFSRIFPTSSRMVYLDHDTRVQYGKAGGVYVLKRTFAPQGYSTKFVSEISNAAVAFVG